jgi:hypothetical protein
MRVTVLKTLEAKRDGGPSCGRFAQLAASAGGNFFLYPLTILKSMLREGSFNFIEGVLEILPLRHVIV